MRRLCENQERAVAAQSVCAPAIESLDVKKRNSSLFEGKNVPRSTGIHVNVHIEAMSTHDVAHCEAYVQRPRHDMNTQSSCWMTLILLQGMGHQKNQTSEKKYPSKTLTKRVAQICAFAI